MYFDNDTAGSPYNGVTSILGRPSPVDVDFDTSAVLTRLTPGETYYTAVVAYDLSGNESPLSPELSVETACRVTAPIDSVGH